MPFNLKEVRWYPHHKTYHPLPPGEKDTNSEYSAGPSIEDQHPSSSCTECQQPTSRKSLALVLLCGGTLLLLFLGIIIGGSLLINDTAPQSAYPDIHSPDVQQHFLTPQMWNDSTPSPCGSSIESARAAGCQWSAMIWAWFPAACFDWDLENEFLREGEWEWFSSRELHPETKLPRDAVLRGDFPKAYVTGEYHKTYALCVCVQEAFPVGAGREYGG